MLVPPRRRVMRMAKRYRSRPDWWPRFEAADWVLVALFAAVLGFELMIIFAFTRRF